MVFLKFKPLARFSWLNTGRPDSLVLFQGASFALSTAPASCPHLKMANWWPVDHIRLTTPLNRACILFLHEASLYVFTVTAAQAPSVLTLFETPMNLRHE